MNTASLSAENTEEVARYAADVLRTGGVVLFPTDTLYGLGADALSDEAVAKIYAIKGRDRGKPVHALVSSIDMATQYGEIGDIASRLLTELPRGKLTLIVPKTGALEGGIGRDRSTFGFRIPDNAFCFALVEAFGSPVTATSANVSGLAPGYRPSDILVQFGPAAERLSLVIDAGELQGRAPSTVVDLSGKEPVILREGAVEAPDVWNAIRLAY